MPELYGRVVNIRVSLEGGCVPAGDPLSTLLKGDGNAALDATLKTFLTNDDEGNM